MRNYFQVTVTKEYFKHQIFNTVMIGIGIPGPSLRVAEQCIYAQLWGGRHYLEGEEIYSEEMEYREIHIWNTETNAEKIRLWRACWETVA